MVDLDQLSWSANEEDMQTSFGKLKQWIDVHGLALLRTNQKLPSNRVEAEEIRRQHEKVELKCMKFLALYAKINLTNTPQQAESERVNMDIAIQKFSEHIRARRHVVVSFATLFRHLQELQKQLDGIKNVDLSDLPNSVVEIDVLIGHFNNKINKCLKDFVHLKEEADRVNSSMDIIIALERSSSSSYLDEIGFREARSNIEVLLRETEAYLTTIFESQQSLQLELQIECKMMIIEEDINRCCIWLQKMEKSLVERYNEKIVGMVTGENDLLIEVIERFTIKMKLTNSYGRKLMKIYGELCTQFERDKSCGDRGWDKFEEAWRRAESVATESLGRIALAGTLFHELDKTLEVVEDTLISINNEKYNNFSDDNSVEKYKQSRRDSLKELQGMKVLSNELFAKLRYSLYNEKIKSTQKEFRQVQQTEDMIKMKIFTIAIKLKELGRYIGDEDLTMTKNEDTIHTESLVKEAKEDVDKYVNFLQTTQLLWRSKTLPVTMAQADKAVVEHYDIGDQSTQHWQKIQGKIGSKTMQLSQEKVEDNQPLLSDLTREKKSWDKKWKSHLEEHLRPRQKMLRNIQDFVDEITTDEGTVDSMVDTTRKGSSLDKGCKEKLVRLRLEIPRKEQELRNLQEDSYTFNKTDFKDTFQNLSNKLSSHQQRIDCFLEFERMVEEIVQLLPQLHDLRKELEKEAKLHNNDLPNTDKLGEKIMKMKDKISNFDVDRLRKLAIMIYGHSNNIDWMIEELKVEIHGSHDKEEIIIPSQRGGENMSGFNDKDLRKKDFVSAMLNSTTELQFVINPLPGSNDDQFNIQWYKNNVVIDPRRDPRLTLKCCPDQGRFNMSIERCDYGDAGKYWFEVKDTLLGTIRSDPVTLVVAKDKNPELVNARPLFSERVLVALHRPLTLALKLTGYNVAPASDLLHNKISVNLNRPNCVWLRVSTMTSILFSHPAITDRDNGLYEVVVGDKVVAKTMIIVGEAPKVLRKTINERKQVGEAVSIVVPVESKTNSKIIWKKDGKVFSPSNAMAFCRTSKEGYPVLDIAKVLPMNAGRYECEISNEYGNVSAEIVLDVVYNDPSIRSNVAKDGTAMDRLSVSTGESIILSTTYALVSGTSICWTKDGKPIDVSDPRVKISTHNNRQCSIQIDDTKPSDSGTYTANINGTNRRQSTLLEIMPYSTELSPENHPTNDKMMKKESIIGDNQITKIVPKIIEAMAKEKTSNGDSPVILRCRVEGSPRPNVKWTKDGRDVVESDFIKICSKDDVYELLIYNPRLNDSGTYTLTARNSLGSDQCQCLVRVIGSCCIPLSEVIPSSHAKTNEISAPKCPQRTQMIFSNTVVSSPPQFVSTFTDLTVQEGADVVLKCQLTGQPEPIVWWSRNTHLLENSRFLMSRNANEHSLSMCNVSEEDTGRYSITAENSSGLATCSALVVIHKKDGPLRPVDRSQYKAKSKPQNVGNLGESFHNSTTLSHVVTPYLPDESRIMQASPRGWDDHDSRPHFSNSFNFNKPADVDAESRNGVDFSKRKTKIVKTYHYSGPSGINLPGIGFIPKLNQSPPQSPSPSVSLSTSSSSSSSEVHITRAVFVPGIKPTKKIEEDNIRFSVVESSDCDYNMW